MNRHLLLTRLAVGLLCVGLSQWAESQEKKLAKTSPLVSVEKGDLPIILSSPHGGRLAVPSVPQRQGRGVKSFKRLSDFNTDLLVERLADAIEKKTGKRPYLVIARFHRKYIDANRSPANVFESSEAKVPYDTFHRAIATARQEIANRWGRGVLLDIHGQGAKPDSIFRGTQNGKTTKHLISRFGRESLVGRSSLFGQLAKQGFAVIPAVGSAAREHSSYDGGFNVVTYGSGNGGTIDAIQLELGRELRSTKAIPETARKLANAIDAFANEYLQPSQASVKLNDQNFQPESPELRK